MRKDDIMPNIHFCEKYEGTGNFKITKTSNYPFMISEVKILTSDGDIEVDEINVYKTALRIYIKNNDPINKKHRLRKISNFINNYRYHPNIHLSSDETFVIKSSNILDRPYYITVSGYEAVS